MAAREWVNTGIGILAVAATFWGLMYTAWQIREGAKQIEASTIYTIQKDGREMVGKAYQNADFVDYVWRSQENLTDAQLSNAAREFGQIVQFYSSIYNQNRLGVMSDEAWQVAYEDLCGLLERPAARTMWTSIFAKRAYSEGFKTAVNSCTGGNE
jgi:hypothetical protein